MNVDFSAADLEAAVKRYESLTSPELEAAYTTMLAVPDFGLKIAQAFALACKEATEIPTPNCRVLDAAVVPAFLIGFLAGRETSM